MKYIVGPHAIKALTDIFNLSLTTNSISNIWKLAKIIPILKLNKSPTEPASYRLISLLCNPFKMLERLVFNSITSHIYLSPSQHGFRSQHSTSTIYSQISCKQYSKASTHRNLATDLYLLPLT